MISDFAPKNHAKHLIVWMVNDVVNSAGRMFDDHADADEPETTDDGGPQENPDAKSKHSVVGPQRLRATIRRLTPGNPRRFGAEKCVTGREPPPRIVNFLACRRIRFVRTLRAGKALL